MFASPALAIKASNAAMASAAEGRFETARVNNRATSFRPSSEMRSDARNRTSAPEA